MKRNIIFILGLIFIISIALCVFFFISNNNVDEKIETSFINENTNVTSDAIAQLENKDIILDQKSELNYAINIADSSVRNENSEFIIIGTIESVDGGINYNPTTKEYTNIQTIGNLKINKIIKGDIEEKTIPFIRLGGTIKFSEYEKGLNDAQKSKLESLDYIQELTNEEKDTKYVSYTLVDDISVEVGKTYLMYLNYNEDYERYGIVFIGQGLREIQEVSLAEAKSISSKELTAENKQNIKVKNNYTGEYESLSDVVGDLNSKEY